MKDKAKLILSKIDYSILITMTILIGIGLYCQHQAFINSDDLKSILLKQLVGIIMGYIILIVIMVIDYHIASSLSFILYIMMLLILAYTLVFGSDLNGVKRWVVIFGIPFQPSELTKVVLIIFLAFLCNHFRNRLDKLYLLVILGAVIAIPILLILMEPHMSSGLAILFISCIIVYSSGISYKVIGAAFAFVIPIFVGIVISVTLFNVNLPIINKYQVNRVLFFLSDDEEDNLSGKYQQIQSVGAIGSGGLHGKMIALEDDEDRRYTNIYAKESDFIFAIVGEEFGFIGCFFIVILYAFLIIRCLIISAHAADYMGKLICIGVSAYLMFQTFVNIGVATNLLPNTGLPLPFISYGLTSLISSIAAVGLVLNVGIRKRVKS